MLLIVDIDGSIANWKPRDKAAGGSPGRADMIAYKSYVERLMDRDKLKHDPVVPGMLELVTAMSRQEGVSLLYLTGRSEAFRVVTEGWLTRNGFPPGMLQMRDFTDWSSAEAYKENALKGVLDKHEVIMAIEDEQVVVDMFVAHGVTVLKVCY